MGHRSPKTIGGTPVSIVLYVEDVDTVFKRAADAGGKTIRPVENQFYGDRMGTLEDPFGHLWSIGYPRRGRLSRGDGEAAAGDVQAEGVTTADGGRAGLNRP